MRITENDFVSVGKGFMEVLRLSGKCTRKQAADVIASVPALKYINAHKEEVGLLYYTRELGAKVAPYIDVDPRYMTSAADITEIFKIVLETTQFDMSGFLSGELRAAVNASMKQNKYKKW